MNKIRILTFLLLTTFIIFGVYGYSKSIYNKELSSLNKKIKEQEVEIIKLRKKEEINTKIEKYRAIKRKIVENKLKEDIKKLKSEEAINNIEDNNIILDIPEEKILDINFYSQFPLDIATGIKYDEPYQNFCEESSLLNGYYYLIGKQPTLDEYNKDLLKLKEIEDLILEGGYKHSGLEDTLKTLIAFQDEDQKVSGEIIENPTLEIIKYNISKGNPIVVPLYGKGLTNSLFIDGGPVYHNLIIKGFREDIFIVNEVGVSNGDGFKYKQKELIDNIYNYDSKLYPDNFTKGKKEILVLYK